MISDRNGSPGVLLHPWIVLPCYSMPKAWTIKRSATLKDLRDSTLSERERIGYDGFPKGKGGVAMMFATRGMALVSSHGSWIYLRAVGGP